ncbi:MAG: LysR family transcriptional regulator [Sphingomonadales bacterium]|nr:LysR family transcriptional regulator [Sphingomonadales bacterium]MBD3772401.1 LysR family transcriptional regulator [Paracoccaceae bacterium]
MLNLSLRQLAAIRSLARTGRINRTAATLGLTGPAVTLQLRAAEDEIGARLFDRTRAGLVPTEIGQAVVAAAEEVLERLHALEDETRAMVSGRLGRVRLGAVSTAKYFAPAMIAAFSRRHPGIEVQFLVGNRTETIDRIRHNELDLVIMGRPPRDLPLESAVIGDHPFVVIAAPGHPLAGQRQIRKERLIEETFLLRERGSGTRNSLDLYFADLPEKRDNLGMDMGSNESIKQAVMAGLGIALLSAHTVAAEVGQGWLSVLDVEGLPILRQWYCVTPGKRTLSSASLALRDFLTGEGAHYLPQLAES